MIFGAVCTLLVHIDLSQVAHIHLAASQRLRAFDPAAECQRDRRLGQTDIERKMGWRQRQKIGGRKGEVGTEKERGGGERQKMEGRKREVGTER